MRRHYFMGEPLRFYTTPYTKSYHSGVIIGAFTNPMSHSQILWLGYVLSSIFKEVLVSASCATFMHFRKSRRINRRFRLCSKPIEH
jgi:hypothetical protein